MPKRCRRSYARHRLMARATRAAAGALGLKLLAPENPAPGVTGIMVPDRIDGSRLVRYMRDVLGVTAQGGQDQMKGKLIRVGHMGYVAPLDILIAVGALELALRHEGYDFQSGAGRGRGADRNRRRRLKVSWKPTAFCSVIPCHPRVSKCCATTPR